MKLKVLLLSLGVLLAPAVNAQTGPQDGRVHIQRAEEQNKHGFSVQYTVDDKDMPPGKGVAASLLPHYIEAERARMCKGHPEGMLPYVVVVTVTVLPGEEEASDSVRGYCTGEEKPKRVNMGVMP